MGERGPKPKHLDASCPNECCPLFALPGRGNVISRGTYRTKAGDEVRKFECKRCGRVFNSRTGTAYEHIHAPQREFDICANALCEGMGIRAAARVLGISKDTVQKWSAKCAGQCGGVAAALEDDLASRNIQFDEMTATLKKNPPR